ncbi:MAG: PD-(D/E)XK nuclease family protein, partial [Hyphomonadaceae bacterium]
AHHELAASERAHALAERLRSALNPLAVVRAREAVTLDVFADALTQTAETLAGGEAWAGRDGERVANLLREAIAFGDALGPMTAYAASRVVLKVMDATEAPPLPGGEARLAIWGPLEARLQRRDLMILGGLNEGVWPAPAPEDPFLSRGMRAELGLPLLDQRIGLAAHDFAQLANAPDVVMTRALRRDGAPTLASRWLWRLQTLIKGAGATLPRASAPLSWARTLDAPQASRSVKVPRPRPPSDARLKRLSVTQVETLIRDPYAIYARRILGLEVLKPIGAEVGPAERGTAIHKAVERLEDRHDHALLRDLLDEELRRAGVSPERRAAERSRLEQSVRMLLSWLQAREQDIAVYREIKGQLELQVGVTLTGTADRIETGPRGAAILDFKTGSPPSDAQVASGLAPQLLLEAAMLKRGAFEGAPAAIARELIYWRFGGANPAPRIVHLDDGVGAASEKALAELNGMLARYADAAQPFLSKPRVQFIKRYADYDHLARRKEWADAELDE